VGRNTTAHCHFCTYTASCAFFMQDIYTARTALSAV
jgi:hypothetical protein